MSFSFFKKIKTPQWKIEAQYMARSRWISHVCDFTGDPTNEWAPNPGGELPNRPEFIVLEFSPTENRPYWTYLSAGLSLVPQTPPSEMPHLELIAYSATQDSRIGEFIFMLAHDIAINTHDEPAFSVYDLWKAEIHGLSNFMLTHAKENSELLDFPNRNKRAEDERFLLAATGDLQGELVFNLLQLVPLTEEEWKNATQHGTRNLIKEIDWEEQPKFFGWSQLS